MERRGYLVAVGTTTVAALAGCLDEVGLDDGSDTSENGAAGSNGESDDDDSPTDEEHEALAVVDAYFEAADDDDLDALADHMHTHHPFDPETVDEDSEDGFSYESTDVENVDRELADEDFETEDVRAVPNIEFWFEDADVTLDEILDGEAAVLVRATYDTTEDGETVEETERFIVLTEDGDWKVFFPYEEPPEIPDDDPVDDEEYQIVDEIEYETETELATVHVSGAGDVEAEELIAYSTSFGDDSAVWSEDSETLPPTNYFTVPFDPEGDEIVVTLLVDDDEIVIHREEYEP